MSHSDRFNTRICAAAEKSWILIMFQALRNANKLDALMNPSLSQSFRE
jgi:hypothetical protein